MSRSGSWHLMEMLFIPGGWLVEKIGVMPGSSSFIDELFVLNDPKIARHESFKAKRHSLTKCTDTALRARSFRVTVRLVPMNVDLSKVGYMNKMRFMRCGMALWEYPGGPCEQRDPSSCPLSNDLFSRSNLFV